jgi:hypothetical protein
MPWETIRLILVILGAFLAIRELLTWYWQINRVVSLLESIAWSLGTLPSVQAELARTAASDARRNNARVIRWPSRAPSIVQFASRWAWFRILFG